MLNLRRTIRLVLVILFGLACLALLGLAVLAYRLGIDHTPDWGASRLLMAVAGGAGLAALGLSLWAGRLRERKPIVSDESAQVAPAAHKPDGVWLTVCGAVALLIALWYITSGTLTRWTPYWGYFDLQAEAFRAGELALLEEPPQALLDLPNPYDWRAREGIPHLWDATLYQGKYYLYWGPVPALVALGVKVFAPGVVVEDQFLLFGFFTGITVCLGLLLHWMRARLFHGVPAWTGGVLLLAGMLSLPPLWLINRPTVYETAIAGGQFFLLAGLYAALRGAESLEERGGRAWWLAAGFAWGAAVGCRFNYGLVVVFLFAVFAGYTLLRKGKLRVEPDRLGKLGVMLLPLTLWAGALLWYNAARFGSPLETGHRYQLTGMALPADYSRVFSLEYVIPNLYNIVLRPPVIERDGFPFVFTPFLQENMWPTFLRLPETYYYSEPIAGYLFSAPLLLLLPAPVIGWLRAGWDWLGGARWPVGAGENGRLRGLFFASAAGGALINTALLAVFISSSMRYLNDAYFLLFLLAAFGLWWGWEALRGRPGWKAALAAGFAGLALASLVIGLLGNFQNGDKLFEANNPELYGTIARFFNRWLAR